MATTQFKVEQGLYSNGNITVKSVNTGNLSSNDHLLCINSDGTIQYANTVMLNNQLQISQISEDGFVNAIIFG